MSLERQIKTSPGRHFRTFPGRQIGMSPGRSYRIFSGRPGDVGGGRPRDQCLPAGNEIKSNIVIVECASWRDENEKEGENKNTKLENCRNR